MPRFLPTRRTIGIWMAGAALAVTGSLATASLSTADPSAVVGEQVARGSSTLPPALKDVPIGNAPIEDIPIGNGHYWS